MSRLRFLAHAIGAAVLAAGLTTAVLTGTASACSCYPGDTEPKRYERAQHVFSGTVVASTVVEGGRPDYVWDDLYDYTVEVDQEYKGDVPATVSVTTNYATSMCGLGLSVGVKYLVFAFGDASDGVVSTNSCSGTRGAAAGPPVTTTAATSAAAAAVGADCADAALA
ncbi:hypothetical protein [Saccharothrix sp. HUAS TT1]|uniref:hypothetical protein n=1 Tax=unclassified Saccharothrix TaxID=2593673 RepID=UPI00345C245D